MSIKPSAYPIDDPLRRTGRTTRMLVAALHRFLNESPRLMYVQSCDIHFSRTLMNRMSHMLNTLTIPHHIDNAINCIQVDRRRIMFITSKASLFGVPDNTPMFVDHYQGNR
jgi:hypothetical protein